MSARRGVPGHDRSAEARRRGSEHGERRVARVQAWKCAEDCLRVEFRRRARDRARLPPIRIQKGPASHLRCDADAEERRAALDGDAAARGDEPGLRLPQGLTSSIRATARAWHRTGLHWPAGSGLESMLMAEIGTMRVKSGLAEM